MCVAVCADRVTQFATRLNSALDRCAAPLEWLAGAVSNECHHAHKHTERGEPEPNERRRRRTTPVALLGLITHTASGSVVIIVCVYVGHYFEHTLTAVFVPGENVPILARS